MNNTPPLSLTINQNTSSTLIDVFNLQLAFIFFYKKGGAGLYVLLLSGCCLCWLEGAAELEVLCPLAVHRTIQEGMC